MDPTCIWKEQYIKTKDKQKAFDKISLGQGTLVSHVTICDEFPRHCFPPKFGKGLSHLRSWFLVPTAQVTEQSVLSVHTPQLPSTKIGVKKVADNKM